MRFRTQLGLGLAAMLAITLASAITALSALDATTRNAETSSDRVVQELSSVHAVKLRTEQLVSASRGYLLSGDRHFQERLQERQEQFAVAVESLRSMQLDSRALAELSALEQMALAYVRSVSDAARVRADIEDLEQAFESRVAPQRLELEKAVDTLVVDGLSFLFSCPQICEFARVRNRVARIIV